MTTGNTSDAPCDVSRGCGEISAGKSFRSEVIAPDGKRLAVAILAATIMLAKAARFRWSRTRQKPSCLSQRMILWNSSTVDGLGSLKLRPAVQCPVQPKRSSHGLHPRRSCVCRENLKRSEAARNILALKRSPRRARLCPKCLTREEATSGIKTACHFDSASTASSHSSPHAIARIR